MKHKYKHISIDRGSLGKLRSYDPKECELGTLYVHIAGHGRYKATDLYNVKCKSWFDHVLLQDWLDYHQFVPVFHVRR